MNQVMDYATAEHFYTWLEAQFREEDQHQIEQDIHALLRDYPELLDTHSWWEILDMTRPTQRGEPRHI